jgi:hypothetical protein
MMTRDPGPERHRAIIAGVSRRPPGQALECARDHAGRGRPSSASGSGSRSRTRRRHARAAGHPAAVRRRDPDGRLGADLVQPRLALAAVPAAYAAAPRPSRRSRRDARLRGRVLAWRARARRSACSSARAACRRSAARCSSAQRSTLLTEIEGSDAHAVRTWATRGSSARRSARDRRDPHGDARLGVDLLRPGAARARDRSLGVLRLAGRARSSSRRDGRTSRRTSRCCCSPARSTAALFLLVLLLVDGWRMDPAVAGSS